MFSAKKTYVFSSFPREPVSAGPLPIEYQVIFHGPSRFAPTWPRALLILLKAFLPFPNSSFPIALSLSCPDLITGSAEGRLTA